MLQDQNKLNDYRDKSLSQIHPRLLLNEVYSFSKPSILPYVLTVDLVAFDLVAFSFPVALLAFSGAVSHGLAASTSTVPKVFM